VVLADLDKFKGKLKGKMVLLEEPRPSEPITARPAKSEP